MSKSRVLTFSYIMEDGIFEVLDQDAGEFKWWTYLANSEMSSTEQAIEDEQTFEIDWAKTIDHIVDKWDLEEEDKEFGYFEKLTEFKRLVKKYKEQCAYNGFCIVNWSVEYDVNVSVIVNMD